MQNTLIKELTKANELMEAGEKEKAYQTLQLLLANYPNEKRAYQDAVSIYLLGEMYEEAKKVFDLYKARTGQELNTDYSYNEIEEEQSNRAALATKLATVPTKIFRRMGIRERGHFSNYPTLWPVKEIVITNDGIALRKGAKNFKFKWQDISSAVILKRRKEKAYGKGATTEFLQKLFELRVAGMTFRFDVSSNFPDFKYPDLLVAELRKHLKLEEKTDDRKFRLW
jgi:hypothetical protein